MNLDMRQFKRGLGDANSPSPACVGATNPFSANYWSCIGSYLSDQSANLYSYLQYGTTPAPTGVQPPGAPQTDSTGTATGTADQIAQQQEQGSVNATIAAQQAAITAAIASGAYSPSGNLPVTATQVSNYAQNPLNPSNVGVNVFLLLGAGLLGLVALKAAQR